MVEIYPPDDYQENVAKYGESVGYGKVHRKGQIHSLRKLKPGMYVTLCNVRGGGKRVQIVSTDIHVDSQGGRYIMARWWPHKWEDDTLSERVYLGTYALEPESKGPNFPILRRILSRWNHWNWIQR